MTHGGVYALCAHLLVVGVSEYNCNELTALRTIIESYAEDQPVAMHVLSWP
jgi:hypothetical protein